MKNRQKTKWKLGKKSNALRSLQKKRKNQSANRPSLRGHDNDPPHSTKISDCSMNLGQIYRTNKYECNFGRKGRILDAAQKQDKGKETNISESSSMKKSKTNRRVNKSVDQGIS